MSYIFDFGRHKGKTIQEVFEAERNTGYFEWAIEYRYRYQIPDSAVAEMKELINKNMKPSPCMEKDDMINLLNSLEWWEGE